jgi:MFS family permease
MTDLEKQSQKITITLLAGQSLFWASLIMSFTVGSIIAVQLANNNSRWTGVPGALVVAGAALIAYPIGRLMDRAGRRIGLSVGYVLGINSMLVAAVGVIMESLYLFLFGFLLLGLTRGVLDQSRYAAAEASSARRRGQAISWVVLGGTAGSILGPGLIKVTTQAAAGFGLPEMSGPWFLSAFFFGLSLLIVNIFLRPDPQVIGRQWAAIEDSSTPETQKTGRPYTEVIRDPRIKLATGTLIFAQVTMVVVMVVTPVHMHNHQHELGAISLVIMAHTLGMFGLSFITGWLVGKLGWLKVIVMGGLILSLACFMAPFSTGVTWLAVALFLLGLGWNFCFVAGSTILSDVLRSAERGRVQGLTDTLISITSGLGNLSSGLIFAALGFTVMSWLAILMGLAPVILVILWRTAAGQKVVLEGAVSG